ncbi:MAG: DUF393 domain-containing protein [Acidobacteria bacterium]|nr:MAG: DUF393 domain-containing protein [Acidobacteriota bacterium]
MGAVPPPPVLLYDGTCGLCAGAVRFVLRHDRRKLLRFASLDSNFARPILSRQPELPALDTVVWYEPPGEDRPERLLTRSTAILQVLRYLGGRWKLGLLAAVVPRSGLDFLYGLVARSRRRLSGHAGACVLPPPAERHRFLD